MENKKGHLHSLLEEMIDRLTSMTEENVNDRRQEEYCRYINILCSHYKHDGKAEECKVVGSTRERLRLRMDDDDGDFDYLGTSWIEIPTEALEERPDFPCFVHVKGEGIKEKFRGTVELSDGIYLPTSVLRDVNKTAFPILKGVLKMVSSIQSAKEGYRLVLRLKKEIKPGICQEIYCDWECKEFHNIEVHDKGDISKICRGLGNALSGTLGLRVCDAFKKSLTDVTRANADDIQNVLVRGLFTNALQALADPESFQNRTEEEYCLPPERILLSSTDTATPTEEDCSAPKGILLYSRDNATLTERPVSSSSSPLNEQQSTEDGKLITLRYRRKASKDFIPAFRLSSCPPCIKTWCSQSRRWPPKETIEKIEKSKYYLVAKQCTLEPDLMRDFCLGFNDAELLLADAMLPVQRKCMLIIKAYLKSHLKEFSQDLTTFHWKTAFYRMCGDRPELDQSHPSYLGDTSAIENVKILVKDVLQFMENCVEENKLLHIFCDSNLLAALSEQPSEDQGIKDSKREKRNLIIGKLQYLQKQDIISALNYFFETIKSETDVMKTEYLKPSEINDAVLVKSDVETTSKIDGIITLLSEIIDVNDVADESKLESAVMDVLSEALPFIGEEMERNADLDPVGREGNETASNVQTIISELARGWLTKPAGK